MINNFPMLSISQWANKHTAMARTILIIGHIMLIILAITMGKFLNNISITLPPVFFPAATLIFTAAFMGYPKKNRNLAFSIRYRKQKIFDGLLVLSTFLMILSLSNNSLSTIPNTNAAIPKRISTIETKSNEPNAAIPHARIINKKIERKQLMASMLNFLNTSKQYSSGEKAIITILAVLGALGLLFLLAALACNLSCSGNEGAAVLVGLLGSVAVIILFIKLMKNLHRNPSISRKNKPSSTMGE